MGWEEKERRPHPSASETRTLSYFSLAGQGSISGRTARGGTFPISPLFSFLSPPPPHPRNFLFPRRGEGGNNFLSLFQSVSPVGPCAENLLLFENMAGRSNCQGFFLALVLLAASFPFASAQRYPDYPMGGRVEVVERITPRPLPRQPERSQPPPPPQPLPQRLPPQQNQSPPMTVLNVASLLVIEKAFDLKNILLDDIPLHSLLRS